MIEPNNNDYDPFSLLLRRDVGDVTVGTVSDAITILRKNFKTEKISALLKSRDLNTSLDGLYVLSEVGVKAHPLLDLALMHVKHEKWMARYYLADVLLASARILSVKQLCKSLPLCVDDNVLVRNKLSELISFQKITDIHSAIQLLSDSKLRNEFEKMTGVMSENNFQKLDVNFDQASPFTKCLSAARILMLARSNPCKFELNLRNSETKYIATRLERICRSASKKE